MAETDKYEFSEPRRPSAHSTFVVAFPHTDQGRPAVTLTLKWDVIAVCAVFVFVGAVLLGAF
jgi:hypothetical protein